MTSDAIPQRLMVYAKLMIDTWPQPVFDGGNVRWLASVLLAAEKRGAMEERERAAKIADAYECSLRNYGGSVDAKNFYEGGMLDAGQGIAAAIRNQPEPEAP